jgi:hypothetical protein
MLAASSSISARRRGSQEGLLLHTRGGEGDMFVPDVEGKMWRQSRRVGLAVVLMGERCLVFWVVCVGGRAGSLSGERQPGRDIDPLMLKTRLTCHHMLP